MYNIRASVLVALLLSSMIPSSHAASLTATTQVFGGLALGWAIQHHAIKPICKTDIENARNDAWNVTLKAAFAEAFILSLKDLKQNPPQRLIDLRLIQADELGFTAWEEGMDEVDKWVKFGMKVPLWYEIGVNLHEAYGLYNELSADPLWEINKYAPLHTKTWNIIKDPVFMKGLSYFIYGYSNGALTSYSSQAFIKKLIPDQSDLTQKLGSYYSGTFASVLIKSYWDSTTICRSEKESKEKEFYDKMYLAGLKSYFAKESLTKFGGEAWSVIGFVRS